MKKSYVQVDGKLIPKDEYYGPSVQTHMVMPDIQPYFSHASGEMITSRSHHKSMLKQHGLIEIGNETKYLSNPKPVTPPPGRKEMVIEVARQKLRRI